MKVLIGFIMDLLFGDPAWIPHPIVLIGKSISKCKNALQNFLYGCSYEQMMEKQRKEDSEKEDSVKDNSVNGDSAKENLARNSKKEIACGGILTAVIVGGTYLVTKGIVTIAKKIHPRFGDAIETFLIFQSLATKCLKQEAEKVYDKLKEEDLVGARVQVGYLVGRDTDQLSETEVAKATIETVAENTADGVIAPMFYAAIGGAPLAMAYKAVNTLDSMVGYKNEEYQYLGRISAKMDDFWNFIPARLSALAMIGGAKLAGYDEKEAVRIFKRDRYNHLSPNSAQTESVAAGALHIQLGGTHDYFGKPVEKPTIGDDIRPVEPEDIKRTNRLLYGAAVCFAAAISLVKAIRYLRRK
ncbi:MAG: adenosylcobinamide-phosphate synthase CbiB [Lachnospiraceae bacterium]|nr:adenosylcobinamide-phosphate synthase CbiB [Lachnospiraceae bacterium]